MSARLKKANGTQITIGGAIVRDGLTFYYDTQNDKSYPNSGTTLTNITPYPQIQVAPTATMTGTTVNGDEHLSFDGSDYIELSENFTMDTNGATLMWWMAPSSATTNYDLFGSSNNNGVLRLIEFRQTFFYGETNNNCGYFNSPSFSQWNNNEWHHVAVRFLNEEAHWYIDGINIGETSNYGVINCGSTPLSDLGGYDLTMRFIGGGGYSARYNGLMNQIMLYNRGLSDEEVFQNYRVTEHRYD